MYSIILSAGIYDVNIERVSLQFRFLRDIRVSNVTISENVLQLVHELLVDRCMAVNAAIDQRDLTDAEKADEKLGLSYVIRLDNRGYRLQDANEALRYFQQASEVERIIFTLDSAKSERTGRNYGAYFELRLDAKDVNNCSIQASSDNGDVVDSVYNGLIEIIQKGKNNNGWVRNTWTQLVVQVLGVGIGFVLSLIAAIKTAPNLNVENALVLTFIFAFLIFSNAWGFINQQILRLLNYSFPNIRFERQGKAGIHWLVQTLVGGLLIAFFLFIFGQTMGWLGGVLGAYVS
jgi:hypothetical protein